MSVLQVNSLVKSFGRRRVVDGVSLTVNPGEIVGLLGPNGAGKTTTFRMICGLLTPDSGTVLMGDNDVTDWPMYLRSRHGGMGYLPQQSSVFAKLTVRQNLLAIMQLLKMDRATSKKRCDELLEQFQITRLARSRAGSLSGGERRRLEIARCLVSEPEIIMLDEPFAGIDPVTVQGIQDVIRDLSQTGISILITDHAAVEILQLTDRTYVVSDGRILCSGTSDDVIRHEEVKRKYLGEIDMIRHSERFASKSPAAATTRMDSGTRSTAGGEVESHSPVDTVPASGPHLFVPETEADRRDESSRPATSDNRPRHAVTSAIDSSNAAQATRRTIKSPFRRSSSNPAESNPDE